MGKDKKMGWSVLALSAFMLAGCVSNGAEYGSVFTNGEAYATMPSSFGGDVRSISMGEFQYY